MPVACFDAEKSHSRAEASAPAKARGGTSQIKKSNKKEPRFNRGFFIAHFEYYLNPILLALK